MHQFYSVQYKSTTGYHESGCLDLVERCSVECQHHVVAIECLPLRFGSSREVEPIAMILA